GARPREVRRGGVRPFRRGRLLEQARGAAGAARSPRAAALWPSVDATCRRAGTAETGHGGFAGRRRHRRLRRPAGRSGCARRAAFGRARRGGARPLRARARAPRDGRARELDAITVETPLGTTLLCLPPRRRSESEPLLAALRPYTDGPRPTAAAAPPDGPALVYVVRPDVLKTAGKAMAQAGHAALMCV